MTTVKSTRKIMTINYIKGDLFALSKHSALLAHSCNTHGFWGGGIAYQFGRRFPISERAYEHYCHTHTPSELIGTTLLIQTDPSEPGNVGNEVHTIACLFTSRGGGGNADSPSEILKNTDSALSDLKRQLNGGKRTIDLPQINAGIFGVPWENTEKVLKKHAEFDYNVYVLES